MSENELFTDRIVRQIQSIRASGRCNMLDEASVKRVAEMRGFQKLASIIEENGSAYARFILDGYASTKQGSESESQH